MNFPWLDDFGFGCVCGLFLFLAVSMLALAILVILGILFWIWWFDVSSVGLMIDCVGWDFDELC